MKELSNYPYLKLFPEAIIPEFFMKILGIITIFFIIVEMFLIGFQYILLYFNTEMNIAIYDISIFAFIPLLPNIIISFLLIIISILCYKFIILKLYKLIQIDIQYLKQLPIAPINKSRIRKILTHIGYGYLLPISFIILCILVVLYALNPLVNNFMLFTIGIALIWIFNYIYNYIIQNDLIKNISINYFEVVGGYDNGKIAYKLHKKDENIPKDIFHILNIKPYDLI